MKVIETNHLTKKFGKKLVVSNVNLNVSQGDIYGFLGLNGSGKTTTMRMLLKMIRPSSGYAKIQGRLVSEPPAIFWNQVGYMIESPHAYPNFTVAENLIMYAKQRLIPEKDISIRVNELADKLLLAPYLNVKVKDLSLGNNQKVGLAKALIHRPKILLLDEPTNGLDPESLVAVRNILKAMAAHGTTIFISSHLLDEMEKLVNRIGILSYGHLLREISLSQFNIERKVQLSIQIDQSVSELQAFLKEKGFATTMPDKKTILITEIKTTGMAELLHIIEEHGFRPRSFKTIQESLESFFLRQLRSNNVNGH